MEGSCCEGMVGQLELRTTEGSCCKGLVGQLEGKVEIERKVRFQDMKMYPTHHAFPLKLADHRRSPLAQFLSVSL